ncbi:MAG: NRDE family protein, partial [Planctomycetota bacterium]
MSLLAILYHLVPESPILVACNREDSFDRSYPTPAIHSGKPRILASVDPKTGGTFLGVNQNGMLVGVIDRPKREMPVLPESRADLARQILKAASARRGVDVAMDRLSSGQYRGANFVIADHDSGWCVHAGDQVNCSELEDGLSIVGSCDVNDFRDERVSMANRLLTLQNLDSPIKFLAVASKVFDRGPGIAGRPSMVVRGGEFGTVNSTLIALGK